MKIKILVTIFLLSCLVHSKIKTSSLDEIVNSGEYFVHFKVIKVDSLRIINPGKSEHVAKCIVLTQYKGDKLQDTVNIAFTAFNGKPRPIRLAKGVEYLTSLKKNDDYFYLSSPYLGVWGYKREFQSYYIKNENGPGYTSKKLRTNEFKKLVKEIIAK